MVVVRSVRPWFLLALVLLAELSLVLVGALPPAGKVIAFFFNGLPLGCIWGLTFSFLEGRQNSEVLGAGLSASYIVASGAVVSVGRWLLGAGIPEAWMPATAGLLFMLPFGMAVLALKQLPEPTPEDEALRTQVEYYFSVANLCKDVYLRGCMDGQGFVPLDHVCTFKRLRDLCDDPLVVRRAVESSDRLNLVRFTDESSGANVWKVRTVDQPERWVLAASQP